MIAKEISKFGEGKFFAPGKRNPLDLNLRTSAFRIHAHSTTSQKKRFICIKRHFCMTYINCSILFVEQIKEKKREQEPRII